MLKDAWFAVFFFCYLLSLILELLGLRFTRRTNFLSNLAFWATSFGVVCHAAYLYHNDLLQNDHFFASAGGWFSVLAFAVVLVDLYLSLVSKTSFVFFLLPLTLALTTASILVENATFTPATTCLWVRAIHASSLLLAALLAFFGAAAGAMYFWQRARLKSNVSESSPPLPPLEWLSRACRFAANTTVIALGLGVAGGFYLKVFSGAQSRIDVASIGTPLLFVAALLARLPKRRAKAVDVCAINAAHNFVVGVVLCVLLLFAAFSPEGHWKTLVTQKTNSTPASKEVNSIPPRALP